MSSIATQTSRRPDRRLATTAGSASSEASLTEPSAREGACGSAQGW
jgi:hypothetical protein